MATRKPLLFQSKQKLKFVEWEKLTTGTIHDTVWSSSDTDTESDTDSNEAPGHKLEKTREYQLAEAGVYNDIDTLFAQKPTAQVVKSKPTGPIQVIDSRKAYNLSKFSRGLSVLLSFMIINMVFFFNRHFLDTVSQGEVCTRYQASDLGNGYISGQ